MVVYGKVRKNGDDTFNLLKWTSGNEFCICVCMYVFFFFLNIFKYEFIVRLPWIRNNSS